MDLKQIIAVLGERPFAPKQNFKAYLETKQQIEDDKEEEKEVDE